MALDADKARYPNAVAAGLTLLGGRDIYCTMDQHAIRGHFWPVYDDGRLPPKGTIVFSPGFTEFCEKYSTSIARLHEQGYDVLIIDWPGQGLSGSYGRNPIAVHIDDFETYLRAMDALIAAAGIADRSLILMGHSMGGHLTLRLAARYGDKIRAAVVLSPMIAPPVMPVGGVRILARLFEAVGLGRSFPPLRRGVAVEIERVFRKRNSLSRWQPGYESQFIWIDDIPDLHRSGPTAGWVRAAYDSCARYTLNAQWMQARKLPILWLCGSDERVVHKPSMDQMAKWLPHCTHHEFPDARHELLLELPEIQDDLWKRFDAFIAGI